MPFGGHPRTFRSVGVGKPSRTVRCGLWAGPVFQGGPSVAGVVRSHAERHSTGCHLVKARPMSYGSPSRPTHGTTSTWERRLDALHTEIARGKRERRSTR